MNYFKDQKSLFDSEDNEKSDEWLCSKCGKDFKYKGSIAGIVANHCASCKRCDGLFFLFDVKEKAWEWQKEYFAENGSV